MTSGTPQTGVLASERARPTATGGWREIVQQAGLPTELSAAVESVVRHTRLWKRERADVARELCAHFADGLAAGRTAGELLSTFGNAKEAARLIRAAKRRGRPGWWHAMVWSRRIVGGAAALCLVVYGYLVGRYVLVEPTIAVNYAAKLSERARALPEDQRAWPAYIEAIKAWGPEPEFLHEGNYEWPSGPKDPFWTVTTEWIEANPAGLAAIRHAAELPELGVIYRSTMSPEYLEALHVRTPSVQLTADAEIENPMLMGVLLPHLGEMRKFGRALALDAALAATEGDADRFASDLHAMCGMCDQLFDESMVISHLVGYAVGSLLIEEVLRDGAFSGLLSDTQLTELAHRIGAIGGGDLRFDLSGERAMFADILQRFYSDNGRGDGYPVLAGVDWQYDDFGIARPNKTVQRAVFPLLLASAPSRAELGQMVERMLSHFEADQSLPMWRRDERSVDDEYRAVIDACDRLFPAIGSLTSGSPGMSDMILSRDVFQMRRDAALTTLALELYQRRHGGLPETLDELVPRYLPRVPVDGADGRPLRYLRTATGPALYSIGVDGKDDGGKPTEATGGSSGGFSVDLSALPAPERARHEGDWVIYPRRIEAAGN